MAGDPQLTGLLSELQSQYDGVRLSRAQNGMASVLCLVKQRPPDALFSRFKIPYDKPTSDDIAFSTRKQPYPPHPFLEIARKKIPQGGTIRDIGGGTGGNSIALATRQHTVELYDLSRIAIGQARENAQQKGVRLVGIQGPIGTEPYGEPHSAFIMSRMVHLLPPDEAKAIFDNALNGTAPGGVALLSMFVQGDEKAPFMKVDGDFKTRLKKIHDAFKIFYKTDSTGIRPPEKFSEFLHSIEEAVQQTGYFPTVSEVNSKLKSLGFRITNQAEEHYPLGIEKPTLEKLGYPKNETQISKISMPVRMLHILAIRDGPAQGGSMKKNARLRH